MYQGGILREDSLKSPDKYANNCKGPFGKLELENSK